MARKKDISNVFEDLEAQEEVREVNSDELRNNPKAVLEEDYADKYENTQNKAQTHKRRTFLINQDTSDKIDALSAGKHGFKSEFVNHALELLLQYYDEELEDLGF